MLIPPLQRLTVGRLAKAAEVGVETVRYYQRRKLLSVPPKSGGVRYYSTAQVRRIRFIKKAQTLGFSLKEVATLLDLADGLNRPDVQTVTSARLQQIKDKLADLTRMQNALLDLLNQCRTGDQSLRCPIIDTLIDTAAAGA